MSNDINRIIEQVDSESRYLSSKEFERIRAYFQNGAIRVEAIECISKVSTEIINDSATALFIEEPRLIAPGGNAYPTRAYAACLRDLDLFLRYLTYTILAGNIDVLEDRCLNGLRETYQSLGTPTKSVSLAVTILKLITIEQLKNYLETRTTEDVAQFLIEVASYFDYLANALAHEISNSKAEKAINRLLKLKWEPQNFTEWQKRDQLSQVLKQHGVIDEAFFDESTRRFYETWKHLPPEERRGVWREREVMATLYDHLSRNWKSISTARSVAVAQRLIEGKAQLAGILVFSIPVNETAYQEFQLPRTLNVPSSAPLSAEEQAVPLVLEFLPETVPYSQETKSDLAIQPEDLLERLFPHLQVMQSGDILIGASANDCFGNAKVTLTGFVTSQEKYNKTDIRLLTVGHGFQSDQTEVYSGEVQPPQKIGTIDYRSVPQQDIARSLDITLVKPLEDLHQNLSLKWINVIPKPPVICRPNMAVQMHAGTSGYQTGHVNHTALLDLGPQVGSFPYFTATITARPGDSGALLVTGGDSTGNPFTDSESRGFGPDYLEVYRFAMLGILQGGAPNNTSTVVFRPLDTIFQYLQVQACPQQSSQAEQ